MRRNKHCSRSRRPGGARRKGLCERQEAIKLHSAAAGSAQTQHSPPISRGGGCGEKGRQPAVPPQCPTPGAIRAGACESAGRRGSPQPPGRPRRPGLAPPHLSACGRTPRRTGTRSPARGPRPRGRRAGPRSDRRGRDRPRPQPPALMSPRALPGEGAVGQAWPLSPPRGEGPTAPPPASGPVPCLPPAYGRGPPAAGGHGRGSTALLGRLKPPPGCPTLSSAAISRLTRVRRPWRAPVRAPALPLPNPRCRGAPLVCPAALPVTSPRFDVGHPPLPSPFL